MEIGKGPNVKFLIETDRADGTDGTDSILTPVWRLVVTGGLVDGGGVCPPF